MAQLSEILATERVRQTDEQQRTIHLYADGTFYRAYEWSAWLCCVYIKQFKVTKRMVKTVDADMLFVGFPQTSLEKFVPEGSTLNPIDEKHQVLVLSEAMIKGKETTQDNFDQWRTAIPMVQAKENPAPQLDHRPVSLTGVMKKVLEYNVLEHSPMECMTFISDIQRQLVQVL